MTTQKNPLRLILLLLLTAVLCITPAAADGSVWIDTANITGEAGKTVLVPVKISAEGTNPLFALELTVEKPANAEIRFNADSMGSLTYNDTTGKIAAINLGISGEKTLFYLEVTPSSSSPVDLAVTVNKATEGSVEAGVYPTAKTYTASGAKLAVGKTPTQTTPTTPTTPETPTQQPTETPSEIPTETPDVFPGEDLPEDEPNQDEPYDVPSSIPENIPTEPSSSPAPVTGVLAGLGMLCLFAYRKTH